MNQVCTPDLSHLRGSPQAIIVDVVVLVLVDVDGFLKSKRKTREAHSRKFQTFTASPADPADLQTDWRSYPFSSSVQ
jgi:hypothetical protein